MGSANPQSRKWLLTINNPDDYELDHNAVKNTLHLFNPDYFCLVDEIATTGTKHMHIFIYSKSPIRFSTLKNRFPVAHIDKANGSVTENRESMGEKEAAAGRSFAAMRYERSHFLPQIAGVQTAPGQQKGRITGMWLS